jgi:hypothetical protein
VAWIGIASTKEASNPRGIESMIAEGLRCFTCLSRASKLCIKVT